MRQKGANLKKKRQRPKVRVHVPYKKNLKLNVLGGVHSWSRTLCLFENQLLTIMLHQLQKKWRQHLKEDESRFFLSPSGKKSLSRGWSQWNMALERSRSRELKLREEKSSAQ